MESSEGLTIMLNDTQLLSSGKAYYIYNVAANVFKFSISRGINDIIRIYKLSIDLVYDKTYNNFNKRHQYLIYAPTINKFDISLYDKQDNETMRNIMMRTNMLYHDNKYYKLGISNVREFWQYRDIIRVNYNVIMLRRAIYCNSKDLLLMLNNSKINQMIVFDQLNADGEDICTMYKRDYMIMQPDILYIFGGDVTIINNKYQYFCYIDGILNIIDVGKCSDICASYSNYVMISNRIVYFYDSTELCPFANHIELLNVLRDYGIVICDIAGIPFRHICSMLSKTRHNICISSYFVSYICYITEISPVSLFVLIYDGKAHDYDLMARWIRKYPSNCYNINEPDNIVHYVDINQFAETLSGIIM